MRKGAIIYVSSNREHPDFESKIIQDMIDKKGGLQIYSVTHKPMNLGINKAVGDVGTSGFNVCRQLQMAVEMAEADYVISCEADCLYPPEYYQFVPTKKDAVYRNLNNYILPYKKDYFLYKKSSIFAQVAGRDFLLDRLNFLLKDLPQWNTEMKNFPKEIGLPFLHGWKVFETKHACLTMKTGRGMRKHSNSDKNPVYSLPLWGSAKEIRKEYL